ncbi:hypothetical protein ACLOJK_028909, partial [Asimina triloba]
MQNGGHRRRCQPCMVHAWGAGSAKASASRWTERSRKARWAVAGRGGDGSIGLSLALLTVHEH